MCVCVCVRVCVCARKIYSRVCISTAAISYNSAASSTLLPIQPPALLYCRTREREPQASLFFFLRSPSSVKLNHKFWWEGYQLLVVPVVFSSLYLSICGMTIKRALYFIPYLVFFSLTLVSPNVRYVKEEVEYDSIDLYFKSAKHVCFILLRITLRLSINQFHPRN